jgi:hypothetical protein
MTVSELRDILDGLPDDMEVRIAHAPGWPMEYSLSDSYTVAEAPHRYGWVSPDADIPHALYLAEDSQIGYLSEHVRADLGWG